jgi:hypothetical protein
MPERAFGNNETRIVSASSVATRKRSQGAAPFHQQVNGIDADASTVGTGRSRTQDHTIGGERSMKRLAPVHIKQPLAVIVSPALIDAGDDFGIIIENVGDIAIKDLIIRGNGRTNNPHSGIHIENSNEFTLNNVCVENIEVSGFKEDGIRIWAKGKRGYNNVKTHNCESHDNGMSGINIGSEAYPATPHSDLCITNCVTYQNTGIPGLTVTRVAVL